MSEMWPDMQGSRGGVFISSGLSFEKQLGEREECDARSSFMQLNSTGGEGIKSA